MRIYLGQELFLRLRSRSGRVWLWLVSSLLIVLLLVMILPVLGQPTIFGPKTYTRTSGPPNTFSESFSVSNTDGNFTLNVQNGDSNGGRRVSSAVVELNGVEIVKENDFNQQVGLIQRTVSLLANNTLKIQLKGGVKDSFITVSVNGDTILPTSSIRINRLDPASTEVNKEVVVTVEATVTVSSGALPTSVSLLRYNEQGTLVANLGPMYNDGTHGDRISGDNIFTSQTTIKETTPQAVLLRASAVVQGLPRESEIKLFYVKIVQAPDPVFPQIADAFEAGNAGATMQFFNPTRKNSKYISELSPEARVKLAAAFRSAKLIEAKEEVRIYQVPWTLPTGQIIQLEVGLARTDLGEWKVLSW